jgi:hypothetical protein
MIGDLQSGADFAFSLKETLKFDMVLFFVYLNVLVWQLQCIMLELSSRVRSWLFCSSDWINLLPWYQPREPGLEHLHLMLQSTLPESHKRLPDVCLSVEV